MKSIFTDVLVAFQFLTRLPLPRVKYASDALSRSAPFFPVVGVVIGMAAWGVHSLLVSHLSAVVVAMAILLTTILITGAMHEDGLADAADGFGGGWNREQILSIFKDSRIGSYGALAVVFSVGSRLFLLSQIPDQKFAMIILCAHALCRWTALPLGCFLPPARNDEGQGVRLAGKLPVSKLFLGTVFVLALTIFYWHLRFWIPISAAIIVTALTGIYYKHRLNGITGDCFGATNQLTEIAIYLCGVWH